MQHKCTNYNQKKYGSFTKCTEPINFNFTQREKKLQWKWKLNSLMYSHKMGKLQNTVTTVFCLNHTVTTTNPIYTFFLNISLLNHYWK